MLLGAFSPHQIKDGIAPIEQLALAGDLFSIHQLLALNL